MSYKRLMNKGEYLICEVKLKIDKSYFKGVCYVTIFRPVLGGSIYGIEINYRYKDIKNCIQTHKDLLLEDLIKIVRTLPQDLAGEVIRKTTKKFLHQSHAALMK